MLPTAMTPNLGCARKERECRMDCLYIRFVETAEETKQQGQGIVGNFALEFRHGL